MIHNKKLNYKRFQSQSCSQSRSWSLSRSWSMSRSTAMSRSSRAAWSLSRSQGNTTTNKYHIVDPIKRSRGEHYY
jgi:hypothetical protein